MPRTSAKGAVSKGAAKSAASDGSPKGVVKPGTGKDAIVEPKGSKFQRYRALKRAKGMKLLRIWVPDLNAPGFAEEAERQAKLLRGHPSEQEALDFIEQVFDWNAE